jgi:stress response protein SCP2
VNEVSVNLQKGQRVDLTKGNTSLKHIMVGLGWDEVEQPGGFFRNKAEDIDCDATAFLISAETGKLYGVGDIVYFGNLQHASGAVIHQGDNLTGAGDGDDEQIFVDLGNLDPVYGKIVFVVNIYQARERGQHFGMIRNAFIRLVDADSNSELCRYDLSENYQGMTAMIFGEVYRKDGEWKFNAIGQPTTDNDILSIAVRYGLPTN